MRKEPERRYASVDALADDIRRHLDRRPVLAREGSFRYRAGRFVRRNRAAIAGSVLFAAVLIGGGATAALPSRATVPAAFARGRLRIRSRSTSAPQRAHTTGRLARS